MKTNFPLHFLAAGLILAIVASVTAAGVDVKKLPLPVPRKVDFAKEVYPIFKEACVKCHGPEKQKGKYRIDTKEGAFKDGDSGPFIVAGSSEKSPLIHMVAGLIDEGLMPPPSDKPGESEKLTNEQIGILRAWIDQGATWPDGPIKDEVKQLTFAQDIEPVLKTACYECHGPAEQKGGFRADSADAILKGGKTYGKAVTAGDAKKSPLLTIVAGLDEDLPLPQKHKLAPKQVELIKKWVEQGAK
jgi:mono/diheme cytochrome c family protein